MSFQQDFLLICPNKGQAFSGPVDGQPRGIISGDDFPDDGWRYQRETHEAGYIAFVASDALGNFSDAGDGSFIDVRLPALSACDSREQSFAHGVLLLAALWLHDALAVADKLQVDGNGQLIICAVSQPAGYLPAGSIAVIL